MNLLSYFDLSNSAYGVWYVIGITVALLVYVFLRSAGPRVSLSSFTSWTPKILINGAIATVVGITMLIPAVFGNLGFIVGGLGALVLLAGLASLVIAYRQIKNKRPDQNIFFGPYQ